jgi:molecular chaperone IbpA
MRTYDFSPLWRSSIGFDRLFDLAEMAQRAGEDNYPPYNIERLADDRYQISLAVAGFAPDDVSITAEQNVVTIEGSKTEKAEPICCIAGFRLAASSGSSALPTTCR